MNEAITEKMQKPKRDRCPMCGQVRISVNKNQKHSLCQSCYREILKRYCYYEYRDKTKILRGNTKEVCRLAVEENLNTREISEKLSLNVVYVRRIINENCIKCDTYGNLYPYKLLGRGE